MNDQIQTGIVTIAIENFKAIGARQEIIFDQFTVLIGNNGSGKTSVIEALQLLSDCVLIDVDKAFQEFGGLESIRNYIAVLPEESISETGFRKKFAPIVIEIVVKIKGDQFKYSVHFNLNESQDVLLVEYENLTSMGQSWTLESHVIGSTERRSIFYSKREGGKFVTIDLGFLPTDELMFRPIAFHPFLPGKAIETLVDFLSEMQFLSLIPQSMGHPIAQSRKGKYVFLDHEGDNIAEYILWLRNQGGEYFERLVDLMRFVLPYADSIQPSIISGFNREVKLELFESHPSSKPIPGWLFSGGTLRVLAILSQFVLPKKPPVLFIDEIENGLDPRTIGLILSLIEQEYQNKGMQVIVTSHSPYLLDQCDLRSIVVCEKDETGCRFSVPDDDAKLKVWKEKFNPGQLYTMGKLTK